MWNPIHACLEDGFADFCFNGNSDFDHIHREVCHGQHDTLNTMKRLRSHIKNKFITGILIFVPLAITVIAIKWLFISLDEILGPSIERILDEYLPQITRSPYMPDYGVGLITTILVIYLIGLISSNVLGRRLIRYGESLLNKLPLVRSIYTSSKQIIETLSTPSARAFKRVVLVEFPRKGMYGIGFVTGELFHEERNSKLLKIFVPSTPNPTTGWLVLVPEDEATDTGISVEDGMKLLVSGGIAGPDRTDISKSNYRVSLK